MHGQILIEINICWISKLKILPLTPLGTLDYYKSNCQGVGGGEYKNIKGLLATCPFSLQCAESRHRCGLHYSQLQVLVEASWTDVHVPTSGDGDYQGCSNVPQKACLQSHREWKENESLI